MSDAPAHGPDLGPFRLQAPLARGGMGVIWRGIHRRRGTPVAVKALSGSRARSAKYLAGFRREVQAVAGLDHPGVVVVYDFGEVDTGAAAQSAPFAEEYRLVAGSAYLVMELADRAVRESWHESDRTWRQLLALLDDVLRGLAHAHARGVIHRDLKPGNLLWFGDRVKLADFGIAQDLAAGDAVHAGTPLYMAPEQHLRQARAAGPWTDLYMLGCVAWELCCGTPPFLPGSTGEEMPARVQLREAHLHAAPPPLRPLLPVPAGFEAWMRRLLEKAPRDRFQWAADARHSLHLLGATVAPAPSAAAPATVGVDTAWSTATRDDGGPPTGSLPQPLRPIQEHTTAPVPAMPPRATLGPRQEQLFGAGLGLFGLRSVPVVGRDVQQGWLWERLVHVTDTGRPGVAVLRGSVGSGKSRLARWLQEAAHEAGAAAAWQGRHGLRDGPLEPMVRLLTGVFRASGLPRADVPGRVERTLSRWTNTPSSSLVSALTELLHPTDDTGIEGVRVPAPAERHETLRRVLATASTRRPIIVWLDDVQWGADLVRWAQHCLDRGAGPVLFVLTVRDEAVVSGSEAEAALQRLCDREEAESAQVGPLADRDQEALVRGLLGLDGALARRVEERTAGNPLFAVQLVGDWVSRGVLVPGERGFALRDGAAATIPDGIHGVWSARFGALVDGRSDGSASLQLAAALGHQIDREEWELACAEASTSPPGDLGDQLLQARLAEPRDGGFGWVHPMARESLERQAREDALWARWNGACASMLARRFGNEGPPRGTWERRAQHRIEADDPAGSLLPLIRAARELHRSSDYSAGERLLDLRQEQLTTLGGTGGPDAVDSVIWRLRFGLSRGQDLATLIDRAAVAAKSAAEGGWADLEVEARHVRAQALLASGQVDDAEAELTRARAAADATRPALRAAVHLELAVLRKVQQRATEGLSQVDLALDSFPDAPPLFRGQARLLRAQLLLSQRAFAAAAESAREAGAEFEAAGSRQGQALADLETGEALRGLGALQDAIAAYERAAEALGAIGSWTEIYARMNLAISHRELGADPSSPLTSALAIARRVGSPLVLAMVQALRLPELAGDPADWAAALAECEPLLVSGPPTDSDLLASLRLAVARARSAGALEPAAHLADRLGDTGP